MKRHQILCKDSRCPQPVDMEWVDEYFVELAEQAAGRDQLHPYYGRRGQVKYSAFFAVSEHLGKGPIDNLASRLNFGMDCAVDYYLGDWFVPDDRVSEELRIAGGSLRDALFLAGMTERWGDLEKIRAWLAAHLGLKGGDENVDEYDLRDRLPLCLLSSFGAEPLPGVSEIVAAGMASTNKHIAHAQHTWRALEAASAGDQKAFDTELKEAIKNFLKHDFDDVPNPTYWVDMAASCVWLLAQRKGIKFPKLAEKQDAAVVRRETVGLVAGVDPRPRGRDGKPYPDAPLKRYEVLGQKLLVPTEQRLALFDQEFAALEKNIAPGQVHQHLWRENNLNCCVQLVILEHLGHGPIEGLADRLNYGMDWALEYFFGDWYREDEAERDYARVPEPRQLLLARTPYWQGVLLGGLTGRWADVERIAGWYNAHVDLATQGPLLESYIDRSAAHVFLAQQLSIVRPLQVQLAVAAGLAPAPIPGVEELVACVKGDETRPVKAQQLTCVLWETVVAKHQTAFEKSFHAKTRDFLSNLGKPGADLRGWVDLYASAIGLVAERNGLALPALMPFKDAVVVRRQTIGLA